MIDFLRKLAGPVALLTGLAVSGLPATAPGFDNESLHYNINWPSGLSLGETALSASFAKPTTETPGRRHLEFNIDAAIPGFAVTDRYRSETSGDFCSVEFQRNSSHGRKKTDEKTTFDQQQGTASRETTGGGKTDMNTPQCAKDALSYLYFVRRELSQGRIPPPQTIYFGAPYEIRVEFAGTQTIRIGDAQVEADRLTASIKGAASDIKFEVFFSKDAARTPLLVRVPLTLGIFSMELVR